MFNYITLLTCGLLVALTTAKPLYTTAGSSQLDVRNNYNTGSGYTTSVGYASSPALAPRFVASVSPFAAAAAAYSAPLARYGPSIVTGPFAYGTPSLAARFESPILGAAAPATAAYASSYATPFAAPYAQPISPFSAAYASPYTIAATGPAPIVF